MADISSLVQESLSVSGILLGKSMGRGAELADRFERESAGLADLEVRSRMAGRWMMATIQTSFAVMPALVYLFAGLDGGAVSIGTVVAFTTLQTRIFWPIQSLLNVGVDIQSSSRAVRARVRVPRPAGRHPPGRRARCAAPRGDVALDDVWFRYARRRLDARRASTSTCRPARAPRSSARPARARRRSATSSRGSTTPSAARSGSTASTCAS